MARYAETTKVPVAKSRGEIDKLLRAWGCDGIRWTDHFQRGIVSVEFLWTLDAIEYLARVAIRLPSDDDLAELSGHATTGEFLESKFARLSASRGRQEHRVLLLWLKACLNAVEFGIISAEEIFLPWLVGIDGKTIAETALPRLPQLLTNGTQALIGIPAEVE